MSELKTIERDEKIYQIGAIYEFSNDGESWLNAVLVGVDTVTYNFQTNLFFAMYIRECQAPIGTITEEDWTKE